MYDIYFKFKYLIYKYEIFKVDEWKLEVCLKEWVFVSIEV